MYKLRVLRLLTEFVMVFLGVFLGFAVSNWSEKQRDKKFRQQIVNNLVEDVKEDSTSIIPQIAMLKQQCDSIDMLIQLIVNNELSSANRLLGWTYKSYNVFDPTMQSFESMVFSGDMKLVDDRSCIKSMKELDNKNRKLMKVQEHYRTNVESYRSNLITYYNLNTFDFNALSLRERLIFWNRLKFLQSTVNGYYDFLVLTQRSYDSFLEEVKEFSI